MRRIFWIAIMSLFTTCAFAQDSLNISRVWQSEPDSWMYRLAREGNILYAGNGNHLKTFDISQFDNPRLLGEINCRSGIADLNVFEGLVYVLDDSFRIVDATNPSNLRSLGAISDHGRRIAVNPSTFVAYTISGDAFKIYDVANAGIPLLIASFQIEGSWRSDVAAYGNAAYVFFSEGLQIYDVSDPFHPTLHSTILSPSSESNCVEVIDDTLYVLRNSQLYLFDISTPLSPVEIGHGAADWGGYANRISKSDTIIVLAGQDNSCCFASVADPQHPIRLSRLQPQNWPLDVVTQGRQALFGLLVDDFLLVDFTDPAEPFIADTFTFGQGSRVHCLVGNTMINGLSYGMGLWTADITDLLNPVILDRQYDADGFEQFVVFGNVLAAAIDSAAGFYLYDIHDPNYPVYRSRVDYDYDEISGAGFRDAIAMYGDYVYAAFDSVAIFDISDLENPVQVGSGITESPRDLFVSDNMLYVLGQFQVYACSLDDPANPTYLGGYNFGGTRNYTRIIADGTTIYLYGEGMIQAVDLSDPQIPIELSPIGFFGNFRDFDVENGVLAIGGSSDGVTLVQYADPLNPFVIGYYSGENYPGQVTLRGSNLFVSNYSNIEIFDISAALPVRDNTRAEIPTKVTLSAYPNLFNPSTTIAFDLNARAQVSLDIYDVTGRLVRTLINEQLNAGSYTQNFDAQGLPSGAYFARLVMPQVSQTARITLIR